MLHRVVFIIEVCVIYFPSYKCRTAFYSIASEQTILSGEGRTAHAVKQHRMFSWSPSHLRRSDENLALVA